jgi:flagellar motility protein MotE (MotC chaperone)
MNKVAQATRSIRLIPVVLLATVCLFALKVSGLVFDGGYTLGERLEKRGKPGDLQQTSGDIPDFPKITYENPQQQAAPARKSWAQEMFNYGESRDVTGSVPETKSDQAPQLKVSDKKPEPGKLEVGGVTAPLEGRNPSPGERNVLERLRERNQELDQRSREMEMRENLMKAAEKRLEQKVGDLKDAEQRVNSAVANRDSIEAQRFKGIVSMYENMKPKEAARIFDRLDLKILVDVTTQINPRKMSEILAQMSPEAAERLTVELATRASAPKAQGGPGDQLPKIEGKPGN